jgi:hypothetical protein
MLDRTTLYEIPATLSTTTPPAAIDGRRFARLTKSQRAALAVDVLAGRMTLRPTAKAVSKVLGVSVPYITAAAKLPFEELWAVRQGWRTLRDVTSPPTASPETRLAEIVDEVGIDAALDMLARAETT